MKRVSWDHVHALFVVMQAWFMLKFSSRGTSVRRLSCLESHNGVSQTATKTTFREFITHFWSLIMRINNKTKFCFSSWLISDSFFLASFRGLSITKPGSGGELRGTIFLSTEWIGLVNLSIYVLRNNAGTKSSITSSNMRRVQNSTIPKWSIILPETFNTAYKNQCAFSTSPWRMLASRCGSSTSVVWNWNRRQYQNNK